MTPIDGHSSGIVVNEMNWMELICTIVQSDPESSVRRFTDIHQPLHNCDRCKRPNEDFNITFMNLLCKPFSRQQQNPPVGNVDTNEVHIWKD